MIFGPSSVSSGVSSGTGKNYLSTYNNNPGNGDFETGSTANWSLGTIGTLTNGLPTGSPTFGSGASGNLSIATVTGGSQLAGTYSLSYASSAATTAGDMLASASFTIDIEDRAKVLGVKFYYSPTVSPSNGNWSGTSSNSFAWAAWDVTNSVWLPSTANFNLVGSSFPPPCMGTVQTGATTSQIRFCVYNANATSGAITVLFDDFSVGPQTSAQAPAMSNWVAYIPTGSWSTNTTYAGKYRRVGDSAEVQVTVSLTGAPTSAALTINLPSGLVIDTTKLTSTGGTKAIGYGSGLNAGSGFGARVVYTSTTAIAVNAITAASGSSNYDVAVDATHPGTFANADSVTVAFLVPIVGWDSNAVSSADTDTRVISAYMNITAAATGTIAVSSSTTLKGTLGADTAGALTPSTGVYLVPVSGYYQVGVELSLTSALNAATAQFSVSQVVNGSPIGEIDFFNPAAYTERIAINGVYPTTFYSAGTSLTWTAFQALTAGGRAVNTGIITITRVSGPAIVQATESVNMHYTNANPQAVAGASSAVITTWTKTFDSHNAFNASTGVYTVPVSGKYRVASTLGLAAVAFTVGSSRFAQYGVSGSQTSWIDLRAIWATITGILWLSGSVTLSYNAGDTISVTLNNQTGSTLTLDSTAVDTSISIERVGN